MLKNLQKIGYFSIFNIEIPVIFDRYRYRNRNQHFQDTGIEIGIEILAGSESKSEVPMLKSAGICGIGIGTSAIALV